MTGSREALRRQIGVATDLRAVVGMMKALSAISINQYEQALAALEDHVRAVELGLRAVLGQTRLAVPSAEPQQEGIGVVVFGSDRGLCGALNRLVVERTRRLLTAADPQRVHVLAVGDRLATDLAGVGLEPERRLAAPASAGAIAGVVDQLLVALDAPASRGLRILLVTPRPVPGAVRYQPTVHQLLPLDRDRLDDIARRPWESRRLPVMMGSPPQLLAALTRALIHVDLYRAVAETSVAVHRSRLAAMEAAERNIDDRIDDLTRRYHQQRQAQITEELLEVVAGFETLQHRPW